MVKTDKNRVKIIFIVLFFSVAFSGFADTAALQERVAVLPLWFDEDLPSGDSLSDTVQETIQFMLRLLPNYQLVETREYPRGQSALAAYAEQEDLSSVIYGRVNLEGSQFTISLLLYNAEKDQVAAVKQGTVQGALDLFDLADRLSLGILETYLGRPLEFGTLVLEPESKDLKHYRLFINGEAAGEDVGRFPRFLAGNYRFRVDELLEDGRPVTVFDEDVAVSVGEITRVVFDHVRYADVTVEAQGPKDVSFRLTGDGINQILQDGGKLALPTGTYAFDVTQRDYRGQPYPVDQVEITVQAGEAYTLNVETLRLGRGFEFLPQDDVRGGEYEVVLNGSILKKNRIEVLPVKAHQLEIFQLLQGERLSVFEGTVKNRDADLRRILFPLFATKQGWLDYQRNRYPHFSLVVQALDGAYGQVGFRGEVLQRRLGLSLLGGGYLHNSELRPVVKVKTHWLPLGGGSLLSPEIGIFALSEFAQEGIVLSVGPQIGLTWNTGLSWLEAVYFENDLRYTLGEDFLLTYFFSLGIRLF